MCRLALMNKKGIDWIEKKYGILKFLDFLEKQLGGNGNGYCIVLNNKHLLIKKGVKLTNEEIVNDIKENYNNIEYFIYHTRLASIGSINSENCHPFTKRIKGFNQVLCMNGTESLYRLNNGKTDTENILEYNSNNLIENVKMFRSVFLGIDKGKIFAIKNKGNLLKIEENEVVLFVSSIPFELYQTNKIGIAPDVWIKEIKK